MAAPNATRPEPAGKLREDLRRVLELGDSGSDDEIVARVEKLVADIGRVEGYRASLVDSPLDVSPKGGIQGKFDGRTPGASEARFSIKVTRTTEVKP